MRRLWTEERVTFEGRCYRTDKATTYDRPAEPVPLYVVASGPSAAKLAGRVADGFICTSGKPRELYTETLIPKLEQGLEASGRRREDIELMIEMKVSFDTDLRRALEDTRNWAALALKPEEKTGVEDPVETERLAAARPAERAARRWIVSDDPDEQSSASHRTSSWASHTSSSTHRATSGALPPALRRTRPAAPAQPLCLIA